MFIYTHRDIKYKFVVKEKTLRAHYISNLFFSVFTIDITENCFFKPRSKQINSTIKANTLRVTWHWYKFFQEINLYAFLLEPMHLVLDLSSCSISKYFPASTQVFEGSVSCYQKSHST